MRHTLILRAALASARIQRDPNGNPRIVKNDRRSRVDVAQAFLDRRRPRAESPSARPSQSTTASCRLGHMSTGDRLTAMGIGVAIVLAILGGSCSTNARIGDLRTDLASRMDRIETRLDGIDGRLRDVEVAIAKIANPAAD